MTVFYTSPNVVVYSKKIIRAFKFVGFKIEISSIIEIVNFLDVTLNFSDNSYRPLFKTNQYPSYINVNSNHHRYIIKQTPKAVNTRIRRLSSNEKILHESSKIYIEVLKNSGFKEEFNQEAKKPKINNNNNNNCKLANINIGKYFFN